MNVSTVRSLAFMTVLSVVAACAADADEGAPPQPPSSNVAIDRFKEIVIVDEAVMNDDRTRNDLGGIWSFRRRIETLTAPGKDPVQTAVAWLATWRAQSKVNLFSVPMRPLVESMAVCNWLRATPSNACDQTCGSCAARELKLENLPFRLIAIVNRPDLHPEDPTIAGEGRFIYALTNGRGDDPGSPPLDMTAIFEFRQPLRGRTLRQATEAWHALGRHAAFDDAYKAELETVTRTFSDPGLEPDRPLGSALNQLRTNEREFEWQWDLREFTLTPDGLALHTTENTPDGSVNGSESFARFLRENREQILAKKHVLPDSLAGGAAQILFPWQAGGVESHVLKAFSDETCNGCHQNAFIDFNFHISPHRRGVAKLSAFMHNPADPGNDDIAKREAIMRQRLAAD